MIHFQKYLCWIELSWCVRSIYWLDGGCDFCVKIFQNERIFQNKAIHIPDFQIVNVNVNLPWRGNLSNQYFFVFHDFNFSDFDFDFRAWLSVTVWKNFASKSVFFPWFWFGMMLMWVFKNWEFKFRNCLKSL